MFLRIFSVFLIVGLLVFVGGVSHAQQNKAANFLQDLYTPHQGDSQMSLSKPHRSSEELAGWLSGVVMDSLSIPTYGAKEKVEEAKQYFTKPAYREFLSFLSERSYWLFITQKKFDMSAASLRTPSILCKQDIAGLFNWIFEVPIIVSLKESKQHPSPEGKIAKEKIYLRVRLVRIPGKKSDENNPHQVLIENWRLQEKAEMLNDKHEECR